MKFFLFLLVVLLHDDAFVNGLPTVHADGSGNLVLNADGGKVLLQSGDVAAPTNDAANKFAQIKMFGAELSIPRKFTLLPWH